MDKAQIKYLFKKRFEEGLTMAETRTFSLFVQEKANRALLEEVIGEYLEEAAALPEMGPSEVEAIINRIVQQPQLNPGIRENKHERITGRKANLRKPLWAAAAILLLGLGFGIFMLLHQRPPAIKEAVRDIAPGHSGAVLTLSDGSTVLLDSLGNGVVASQGGAKVVLHDQQLLYEKTGSDAAPVLNTLTTPRGRQFTIKLPDGTRVWINSESSLEYPTVFKGNERKVAVTGEVYFEVAKNKAMPFSVRVNNKMTVEVLGTHFDISAYDNEESLNTSLFEGAIKITGLRDDREVVLKPGQQAVLAANGAIQINKKINEGQILAWKNGLFDFDGISLKEAMRQIERWYDMDVEYENEQVPDIRFYGQINKDIGLKGLLDALKLTGVHFKIEGRKLIISSR